MTSITTIAGEFGTWIRIRPNEDTTATKKDIDYMREVIANTVEPVTISASNHQYVIMSPIFQEYKGTKITISGHAILADRALASIPHGVTSFTSATEVDYTLLPSSIVSLSVKCPTEYFEVPVNVKNLTFTSSKMLELDILVHCESDGLSSFAVSGDMFGNITLDCKYLYSLQLECVVTHVDGPWKDSLHSLLIKNAYKYKDIVEYLSALKNLVSYTGHVSKEILSALRYIKELHFYPPEGATIRGVEIADIPDSVVIFDYIMTNGSRDYFTSAEILREKKNIKVIQFHEDSTDIMSDLLVLSEFPNVIFYYDLVTERDVIPLIKRHNAGLL